MGEIEKCILCFTKCDDWFLLNSEKGNQLNIKEIVLKHFWLEVIVYMVIFNFKQ